MSRARRTLSRQITSAYSVAWAGPLTRPDASISPNIEMIDSGVLSSCETLEMNSLLSALALRSRRTASSSTPSPDVMMTIAIPIRTRSMTLRRPRAADAPGSRWVTRSRHELTVSAKRSSIVALPPVPRNGAP